MKSDHCSSTCNAQRLEAYLCQTSTLDQESDLLSHLEDCIACRKRLEDAAADRGTWDSVAAFLVDDEHDSLPISDSSPSKPQGAQETPLEIASVLQVLAPTDEPDMLGRLGPYEVSGVVGAGGMGVVLKGYDRALDRVVAIKVMAPHLATSGAARGRFAREAKAAAAILHPSIMSIHSVASEASLPYLVMPYLRGNSLQRRIDDDGPLSTPEILRVTAQIAAGLAAAHTQGLVHRDIKPANIMLAQGLERVAITDFGLARAVDDATMTRSGVLAGTPQYMSPEQARGESIDCRSDLFSLGSLIYAMCTGHSPFRAETSFGILRRITDEKPRDLRQLNPEIPAWLARFVELLLEKDREKRVQTARDVEQLANQCLAHLEQPTRSELPPALAESSNRLQRKNWYLPVGMLMCGLLCGLGAWASWYPPAYPTADAIPQSELPTNSSDPHTQTDAGTANPSGRADLDRLWSEVEADLEMIYSEVGPDLEYIETNLNQTPTKESSDD